MTPNALIDRAWRGLADARRVITRAGSAGDALELLGDPDRSDVDEWNRATAEKHESYRQAQSVPDGRVAIVCVSRRPELLEAVVGNVSRQVDVDRQDLDVVYVANGADVDLDRVEQAFSDFGSVHVDRLPPERSLGAGLNRALELTDARFVAKFDDDDLYGPQYLADALRAHSYAGAGVVGKHTYYAHLAQSDETLLRFPTHEFRYSSTLAGGTLVIDRERVGDQRFDDISIGEDRAFIAACHRRGISTFSSDRFNFTQVRSGDNTWTIDDDTFRRGTLDIDPNTDVHRIDR